MKLISRYNRINLISATTIFIVASVAFYFLLRHVLIAQVDEYLKLEQQEIEMLTKRKGMLPDIVQMGGQKIHYQKVPSVKDATPRFHNIQLLDDGENEDEPYREIIFPLTVNGEIFLIHVAKSLDETEEISSAILLITIVTILAMLILGFLITQTTLKKLWAPFYKTLAAVSSYRISQPAIPVFENTKIDEFLKILK